MYIKFYVACVVAIGSEIKNNEQHSYTINDLGLYIEQEKNVIIYSSKASIIVSNVIRMPSIDAESVKNCKSSDQAALISEETSMFQNSIRNALGIPLSGHNQLNNTDTMSKDSIPTPTTPKSPICDRDERCILNPVVLIQQGKEHPVPCFRGGRRTSFCGITLVRAGEEVYCCSNDNTPGCPTKIKSPYNKIKAWINKNQRAKLPLSTNSANRAVRDITSWCFVKTHATGANNTQKVVAKPEGERRPAADQRHHRNRRSNLQYWLSGGALTSNYIDTQISKIKDADRLAIYELKNELEKQQENILQIAATKNTEKKLTESVCAIATELTAEIIQTRLETALKEEITTAESALSTCSAGMVPFTVPNHVLENLCKINSQDSHWCYGLDTRSLFDCKVREVFLENDTVHLHFEMVLSIPMRDKYFSYRVLALPVYTTQHDVDAVTPNAAIKQVDQQKIEEDKAREKIREFAKLLRERKRRSLSTTVHRTLTLATPDVLIVAQELHRGRNDSILSFSTKDCKRINEITLCDTAGGNTAKSCAYQIATMVSEHTSQHTLDKCLVTPGITYSPCTVRRTGNPERLLLSTSSAIDLNQLEESNHFLQKDAVNTCQKGVCLIKAGFSFKCDGQQYRIKKQQLIEATVSEHSFHSKVDLSQLKVTGDSGGLTLIAPFGLTKLDRLNQASTIKRILDLIMEATFVFFMACLLVRCALKLANKSRALKRRFRQRPILEDSYVAKIL